MTLQNAIHTAHSNYFQATAYMLGTWNGIIFTERREPNM